MTKKPAHKSPCLSVCYYPEQWDESLWARDAARMAEIGIAKVRIGEFAWSVIEPEDGVLHWDWLDQAIETLGAAGLEVILGTPTATPPKWLIDKRPEILAWDAEGRPRRFGSRRHYCFSSLSYREETARIVTAMAARYGDDTRVTAWQTDNEYGCHNTTRSYSPAAADAFRYWLKERYGDADALNAAWGTVFWSQRYRSFAEVELPNLTVTEPNPAHILDFYRFSSDQVVSYNRQQTDILRKYAPGRDIIHNFMGFYTEFDHFNLCTDIDIASWDSYPLGFTDQEDLFTAEEKMRYMRTGHPDFAAFHHDLYRGCGAGRWAVMEQQPGPVNWAPNNPAPSSGMARLWAHEAIAHGAEFVSYFRWRQAPFAQEQMHAGLLRPDDEPAPAYEEAAQTAGEIKRRARAHAPVALIYSYDAQWMFEAQPQGAAWDYSRLCFEWYSVLRELGLSIDILPPGCSLDGYSLIMAPSLPYIDDKAMAAFKQADAPILFGPRTGAKTREMQIPPNLAPGPLQKFLPLKVTRSESLRADHREEILFNNETFDSGVWLDHVETALRPRAVTRDGAGALYAENGYWLLTTWPSRALLAAVIRSMRSETNVGLHALPRDLRLRQYGAETFAFNYGPDAATLPSEIAVGQTFRLGDATLPPAGVAAFSAIKGR